MDYRIFNLMQINDGTFPSGGFSQSWGLETYVASGTVKDVESFSEFFQVYIDSNIAKCEGPIIAKAYELAEPPDMDALKELESLSNAVKVTMESRDAGLRMGKALLRVMSAVMNDSRLERISSIAVNGAISYPVIYGVICKYMGVDIKGAIEAYVFNTANALVQSAVKLIPLGNTEAQRVLYEQRDAMSCVAERSMITDVKDITNFCPGLDIASIKHEALPVRLYMS